MISLTTAPGDVVLDPFAGTGSVAVVASHLGRNGLGIEINPDFVRDFRTHGYEVLTKQAQDEIVMRSSADNSLRELIIWLRVHKYAKTLYTELSRGDRLNGMARDSIGAFLLRTSSLAEEDDDQSIPTGKLASAEWQVLLKQDADEDVVRDAIIRRLHVAPLSKFGIQAQVEIVPITRWHQPDFYNTLAKERWHVYRNGKFYYCDLALSGEEMSRTLLAEVNNTARKVPSIISQLKVRLEAPASD
jgi:hypothetical protein